MQFVYLIHFDESLPGNRQHYCGWTTNLENRLHEHKYTVTGARIMQEVRKAGVKWEVVRVWWNGPQILERQIKRIGVKRCCPLCTDTIAHADVPSEYKFDNIKNS